MKKENKILKKNREFQAISWPNHCVVRRHPRSTDRAIQVWSTTLKYNSIFSKAPNKFEIFYESIPTVVTRRLRFSIAFFVHYYTIRLVIKETTERLKNVLPSTTRCFTSRHPNGHKNPSRNGHRSNRRAKKLTFLQSPPEHTKIKSNHP